MCKNLRRRNLWGKIQIHKNLAKLQCIYPGTAVLKKGINIIAIFHAEWKRYCVWVKTENILKTYISWERKGDD